MHPISDSDTSIAPPKRIASYSILLELARGGMAQVFVAQRDGSKDVCVIKRLHAELQAQDAVVKRFYREANLASQLQHPNIARVIDAGFEGRELYIALEYIAGQTVESIAQTLIARGQRLPIEAVIAIGAEVLDALSYAHTLADAEGKALGLVHRDLSPRNIMISYDGDAKIIDFGVARGNVDQNQTEPGILLGTMRYFSPEQARGDPVDHRSDLYSLSVMLWELFAGQNLISPATPIHMLTAVYRDVPALLSTLDPTIPRAIEAVVAAGLAKERDGRWQSAAELRHALLEAAPLPYPARELLGPIMRELFPKDEMRIARLISDSREKLPYDPSRIGLPAGAMSLSDLELRTRTEVLPTPIDASYEAAVTDPSGVTDETRIVPRLTTPPSVPVSTTMSNVHSISVVDPPLSKWALLVAAIGFVILTLVVALLSSRLFESTEPDDPATVSAPPQSKP